MILRNSLLAIAAAFAFASAAPARATVAPANSADQIVHAVMTKLSEAGLTVTLDTQDPLPSYSWAILAIKTGNSTTTMDIGKCPAETMGLVCFVILRSGLVDPDRKMDDKFYKIIADMSSAMTFAKAVPLKRDDNRLGYNIVYSYYATGTDITLHVADLVGEYAHDAQTAFEIYRKAKTAP